MAPPDMSMESRTQVAWGDVPRCGELMMLSMLALCLFTCEVMAGTVFILDGSHTHSKADRHCYIIHAMNYFRESTTRVSRQLGASSKQL
jgi:hypothetical protein